MVISEKMLRTQKQKLKSISKNNFKFSVPKNTGKFNKLKRLVFSIYSETSSIVIDMITVFLFAVSLDSISSINLFLPNPTGDTFSQLGLLCTFLPTKQQIHAQYKNLMKIYHPDLNKGVNSHNISIIINNAYSQLKSMSQEDIDIYWITTLVNKLIPNFLKS